MVGNGYEEQENFVRVQMLWPAQTICIIMTDNYNNIFSGLRKLSFSLC